MKQSPRNTVFGPPSRSDVLLQVTQAGSIQRTGVCVEYVVCTYGLLMTVKFTGRGLELSTLAAVNQSRSLRVQ